MNNNITITNVKGEVGFVCEVEKTINGLSNIFPAVIETQVRRSGNIWEKIPYLRKRTQHSTIKKLSG